MKTFDIAIYHLKDIDLHAFPIVIRWSEKYEPDTKIAELIGVAKSKFDSDVNNNKSNKYYRNMCFATALYHLIFKTHNWVSFFDVACEIIESSKEIITSNFERYSGTIYPKIMVEHWIKYCEELKVKTELLEGEIREDLFFTAYHYIIDCERG